MEEFPEMRALIVDDSAVMRKVVERSLVQAGIAFTEFLQAGNGQEALETVRRVHGESAPLSLILSDINMPVMDGLDFLEQKQREGLLPETPVVMITTEASKAQVMRAIAAGARGYICKPFTADQVKARVMPLLVPAGE